MIEADGGQDLLGFGTVADSVWQTARLKSKEPMDRLATDHSPAWRGLAVSILHVLVLDHLLGPPHPTLSPGRGEGIIETLAPSGGEGRVRGQGSRCATTSICCAK